MRTGCGGALPGIVIVLVLAAVTASGTAADCYFTDLRWSSDGTRLQFAAGVAGDSRLLVVDVSSGEIACPQPHVLEPSFCDNTRRVLFRDRFGVFEVRPEEPGRGPRTLLFLPEVSHHFLRAFGEDALGRILVWTYDRDAAEHAIWTLQPGTAAAPRLSSGPEALRFWRQNNVARPFTQAGGRFMRSTCLRRPGGTEHLCAEQIPEAPGRFRLTLGPPKDVRVLLPACAPTAFAPAPDSSLAVLGLLEDLDETGRGTRLTAWVVRWQEGKRLQDTPLANPIACRERHDTWVRWLGGDRLLWADAAGGLALLDLRSDRSQPLVAASEIGPGPAWCRVVVLDARARPDAESAATRLREAGFEAGILARAASIEVQAGVFSRRPDAEARASSLRQRGFAAAVVREGGAQDVAAGLSFAHASGPGARTACVRNVDVSEGRFSEIWIVAANGAEKRLVPAFAAVGPRFSAP